MTVKEIIENNNGKYADVEVYEFNESGRFLRDICTDSIDFIAKESEGSLENEKFMYCEPNNYDLMSEKEYNDTVNSNCDSTSFGDIFGDVKAKVLVIALEHDWKEHPYSGIDRLGMSNGIDFGKLSGENNEAICDFLQLGGALTYWDDGAITILDESEYEEYFTRLVTEGEDESFINCKTMDEFLKALTIDSLKQCGFSETQANVIWDYNDEVDLRWPFRVCEKCKYYSRDKYDKDNTQRFSIKLNKKTDTDIINWLNNQPSKQGAIKAALELAMKSND